MEIYESFSLKGYHGIFLYEHCRRGDKYFIAEEFNILFLYKYDQITSPGMRISEGFGTLSTRRISP
jgi:hypothetical protein